MTVLKNSDIASLPVGSRIREISVSGATVDYKRIDEHWVPIEGSVNPLLRGVARGLGVNLSHIKFTDADFAMHIPGETLELLYKPEEAVA